MLSYNQASSILTIGCNYTDPKGGVAQVMWNYSHYIFPEFKCIINSGSKNKIANIFIGLNALIKTIITLIKDRKIKIIHIHTASYNSFWRSSLFINVAKLFNKKVVLHIHGGGFKEFFASSPKKISKALEKCDVLIVLSEYWKRFFSDITKRPCVEIVNNIIPYPSIDNRLKNTKSPIVNFLFLGLISEQKGIFDLVSTIAENKSSLRNKMTLSIGGLGKTTQLTEYIDEYKISDIVKYKGWVAGKEKIEMLNSSDVFILPSYTEGIPISILEAMSYNLAIISTPVGGIPEIVKNRVNGLLVNPGDKKMLYNAIMDTIKNPNDRVKMGIESGKCIKPHFPDSIACQLASIYSKLLAKTKMQKIQD